MMSPRRPPHRSPRTVPPSPALRPLKPLLAVGLPCVLAVLTLDFNLQPVQDLLPQQFRATPAATVREGGCTGVVVQANSQITREQLAQVLSIPERDAKSRVRQVVNEPYCQYSNLRVRSGVDAEREAYPLAFDPNTKLVILYENDEYAGYRFSFE